ncbi:zinc-dependent alcohol dehydrogenase family protein [Staphylothermus hellenicus]|uniref:Zinc-binding alcohol dehydrogenase family protein n=1 Tax=Staphylothermus hellenicus (strain DSM 12710 / JCM 10830 / BK20S6-10-b1 / P8) TaxID=591019 RepID=D7D9P9_STAHD|nr:zinc-binding alcohol dehydrogenase family protein [Staphylothermus hellenicus DSM 12710]
MKAMVLYEPGPVEKNPLKLSDVDIRDPRGDEVLLEISCCGVCRTDLHIVEGELKPIKLPLIPGHQVVARVKEVGENVDNVSKGMRVGVPWLYWACGKCKYCRRGLENLCDHALFTGYSVDGGYAEYMIAKKDFVHPLPNTHDDCKAAPLLCAGAVGYRALRLTGLVDKKEGILGLFGFGASAHLILQAAKALGLTVYVFTHTPWKIEYAYKLGADWAGNTKETPPNKLDAAIVFAPVSWVFIEALKKLDKGGRVVLGEIYMSPIEKLDYKLLWLEREVKTTANVTRRDVREFLDIASKHRIYPDITIYKLEEANKALQDLKHGKIKGQAVLKIK